MFQLFPVMKSPARPVKARMARGTWFPPKPGSARSTQSNSGPQAVTIANSVPPRRPPRVFMRYCGLPMRNVRLTIAYDGTEFHGWQLQPNRPTIQGALVEVASRLTQERIFLLGAGRTDAGVHALGQTASFKTRSSLAPQEFLRAFKALLPPAIRVLCCE